MRPDENVQQCVKQTCFAGALIVNVIIVGGNETVRFSQSITPFSLLRSVCFPLRRGLIPIFSLGCPLIQQKDKVVFVVM